MHGELFGFDGIFDFILLAIIGKNGQVFLKGFSAGLQHSFYDVSAHCEFRVIGLSRRPESLVCVHFTVELLKWWALPKLLQFGVEAVQVVLFGGGWTLQLFRFRLAFSAKELKKIHKLISLYVFYFHLN